MGTKHWEKVRQLDGTWTLSLLEDIDNKARFWASIKIEKNSDGKHEFCCYSKDRVLYTVLPEQYTDTIYEAQEAIAEFLYNEGII